MSEEYKLLQPLQYTQQFLNQDIRPDGRKFDEFRSTLLNSGSVKTADGSAMVKMGNTAVICGIKSELIEPKPDSVACGLLTVKIELPPLCSSKYLPGVKNNDSLVLTQLIENIIKNSKLINLEKLCVTEGKLVWNLNVEVICLNCDGNVIDASISATIAALKCCSLPLVEINDKNEITYKETKISVETTGFPISSTFAIVDRKTLADPNGKEENLADSVITYVINADNNMIHLINKTGGDKLDSNDIEFCYKIAKKRSKQIKKLIEKSVASIDEIVDI